jgi:hypothetical protein
MKIKVFILLILLLVLPTSAHAVYEVIDSRCTTDIKITLRSKASSFTYSVNKININDVVTYDLELLNIDKLIKVSNSINNVIYTSDGVINNIEPGTIVKLNIYASDATYCNDYKVSTRLVQIPYYNKYYKNSLCNGYEYYYLCKENSDVRLTDEQFEKNMKAYIDSLKKINEEESNNNNSSSSNKFDIVSFIVKYNVYISGFGGILLVLYVTYMIKKMNKERGVL